MVKTRKAIQEENVATYAAVTRMTRSKNGGANQVGESSGMKSTGKVLSWSGEQNVKCFVNKMRELVTDFLSFL